MNKAQLRIQSYLLGVRLPQLGEAVPGSDGEDAAPIPSDVSLKDFILNFTPLAQKICLQNPNARKLFDAAFAREAAKTMTEYEKKMAEIAEAKATKKGTPRNPYVFRVADTLKEKK